MSDRFRAAARGDRPELIARPAVTQITWTATKGAEIKPGQVQEFDVSLGLILGFAVFRRASSNSTGSSTAA